MVSPCTVLPTNAVMADLFDEGLGWWNVMLIEGCFLPFEAQKIKSTPVCLTLQEDIPIWPKSKDGVYRVKTGYQQLCGMEGKEEASGSGSGESK